jgi:ATP-dependent DNA ligase
VSVAPMEARSEDVLPSGGGWQYEPKWDGFRCIAVKRGTKVELFAKSGKPLGRYFPDMVEAVRKLPAKRFILDGELTIPVGNVLSFDALQMRLHPAASRVAKLAAEQPSILILFDMVEDGAEKLIAAPLDVRRAHLERFLGQTDAPQFRLSPVTFDVRTARRWLSRAGGGSLDGVIAKRRDEPYQAGERAMLKVKCLRTADCVVGGFRYAEGGKQVGSLLLGLYDDDGKLDHVGFTSGFADVDRAALTRRLETLKGGAGFTGDAPGGPSRWSTERSAQWVPLKPKLIAEVRYDHVTGDRFRHGTKFLRWRPDKRPDQCTFDQLTHEARPGKIIRDVIA